VDPFLFWLSSVCIKNQGRNELLRSHIQDVPFKTRSRLLHMDPIMHKTTKPMATLNSCSQIPLLQLMHCMESARPSFKLFCRSMNTCHRQKLCPEIIQCVPKVTAHWNIRQTRAPVRSSSRSVALQAGAAQHTCGAVKKGVRTCLQARGGHSQHLL
jgi:hypothetical protein